MVFNQKPCKPIRLTAHSSKNAQGFCQPNKDSICYNLPLHAEKSNPNSLFDESLILHVASLHSTKSTHHCTNLKS